MLECEDIMHLFIRCNELKEFKNTIVLFHLESLLKDCENSVCNRLNFEEIFMTALHIDTKHANIILCQYVDYVFIDDGRYFCNVKRNLMLKSSRDIH
jgi:hypothetical protein